MEVFGEIAGILTGACFGGLAFLMAGFSLPVLGLVAFFRGV
ncbi:MAG: hypothetical protein M2R45_01449 [Verrucomicrobia subdivision 3 bacterium]|nr:hypothetical protein [Limisphaerales bacterium]MCS1417606.1 hypothetical protein [Limisphaerales bacterium]